MPDLQAKVQRLGDGVGRLADDVEGLATTVVKEVDARRRLTRAASVRSIIEGVFVLIILYLAVENHAILSRFQACTTPGTKAHPHKCYDDGRKATADAVSKINENGAKASAYAVECVIAGRGDVETCVAERFAGAPRPAPDSSPTDTSGQPPTTTTTTRRPRLPHTASPSHPVTTPTTRPMQNISKTTSTTSTTVQPCNLDFKVFCVNSPTTCTSPFVGTCLPTVKGPQ